MIKLTITEEIKSQYQKILYKSSLTPKTKKKKIAMERFFLACKNIGINIQNIYEEVFLNENLEGLIDKYGEEYFDKKDYNNIYNAFRKNWAYKFVKILNLAVCPYCNRNFIVNYGKAGTTVEFDHFYPKSKYPYLALSLYNLIPVCHTCNHKKAENELQLHPFEESYDDLVKLSFVIKSAEFTNQGNIEPEFILKNDSDESRHKIDNYHETLNIEDLYKNHKDIVIELIQKSKIYNQSYINELNMLFGDGRIFFTREELLRLITGGYVSRQEINKRPLNKLIRDVSKELNLK